MLKQNNILWKNGPHKVVDNNNGTVSAWVDCDQIDWTQFNQDALDNVNWTQRIKSEVVSEMPRGGKLTGIVEVVFRNYDHHLSNKDLDDKMAEHGETMISPFFQTKINEIFPELSYKYPNGSHWKDKGDNWYYATFLWWGVKRLVHVDHGGNGWYFSWWFGGFRKSQT